MYCSPGLEYKLREIINYQSTTPLYMSKIGLKYAIKFLVEMCFNASFSLKILAFL